MDVFSRPQKAEKSPNYGAECEQLCATRLFRFRDTVHNRTQLPAPGQSPPIRTASFGTARTMNPVSWGRHAYAWVVSCTSLSSPSPRSKLGRPHVCTTATH